MRMPIDGWCHYSNTDTPTSFHRDSDPAVKAAAIQRGPRLNDIPVRNPTKTSVGQSYFGRLVVHPRDFPIRTLDSKLANANPIAATHPSILFMNARLDGKNHISVAATAKRPVHVTASAHIATFNAFDLDVMRTSQSYWQVSDHTRRP